jgi:hypothetical protein
MKFLCTILFSLFLSCSLYAADEKTVEPRNKKIPLIEITHWMRVKHSVPGLRPVVDTSIEVGSSVWQLGVAVYSAASRYAQGIDSVDQPVNKERSMTPPLVDDNRNDEGFVELTDSAPQLYDCDDKGKVKFLRIPDSVNK